AALTTASKPRESRRSRDFESPTTATSLRYRYRSTCCYSSMRNRIERSTSRCAVSESFFYLFSRSAFLEPRRPNRLLPVAPQKVRTPFSKLPTSQPNSSPQKFFIRGRQLPRSFATPVVFIL